LKYIYIFIIYFILFYFFCFIYFIVFYYFFCYILFLISLLFLTITCISVFLIIMFLFLFQIFLYLFDIYQIVIFYCSCLNVCDDHKSYEQKMYMSIWNTQIHNINVHWFAIIVLHTNCTQNNQWKKKKKKKKKTNQHLFECTHVCKYKCKIIFMILITRFMVLKFNVQYRLLIAIALVHCWSNFYVQFVYPLVYTFADQKASE
jgi:hypothetical protein